jgi:hypothetical protein
VVEQDLVDKVEQEVAVTLTSQDRQVGQAIEHFLLVLVVRVVVLRAVEVVEHPDKVLEVLVMGRHLEEVGVGVGLMQLYGVVMVVEVVGILKNLL